MEYFSWFENPQFKENQKKLLEKNKALQKLMMETNEDPFSFDTVFDSKNALSEQKLPIPNLLGKSNQFQNIADNNPLPDTIFGNSVSKESEEPASNFLGTQGEGEGAAIFSFGKDAFNVLSTRNQNEGQAIGNSLNLGMKGAQAGMSVGGPVGAGVGAAVGLTVGIVDAFSDISKNGRDERKANKEKWEKEKTQREQEQRQKDGIESLQRLTQLRKEQSQYV